MSMIGQTRTLGLPLGHLLMVIDVGNTGPIATEANACSVPRRCG